MASRHDPNRPTVPEIKHLIAKIYEKHAAGCCLHLVVDDQNVDDHSIAYCLQQARERKHKDCEYIANQLLRMSRTQRLKIRNT